MAAKSFRDLIGAPPGTASTADTALIIIDAQNEYADGQLKVANVDGTRSAIKSLLDKYRAAKNPSAIYHILHSTPAGAPVFTPDSPLAQEFSELAPQNGEQVIHKQFPGSFTSTELGTLLEQAGTKKVLLTGYMAHVCVSTTARQAAERGYEVLLAREAIGDRDIPGMSAGDVVESSLKELGDAFGTVVGVGEVK